MYHDIIRDTEIFQIILQEGRQEGLEEGRQDGRQEELEEAARVLRQGILAAVQSRFPELAELAGERVSAVSELSALQKLTLDIASASSEDQARTVLDELGKASQGH